MLRQDQKAHITIDFSNFISSSILHIESHLTSKEYHTTDRVFR